MNGYTGKVLFVKTVQSEYTWALGKIDMHFDTEQTRRWLKDSESYALVGESEIVSVDFMDTRDKEIEGIEKAIQKERAESQMRINVMLGRIQELRALEHAG